MDAIGIQHSIIKQNSGNTEILETYLKLINDQQC